MISFCGRAGVRGWGGVTGLGPCAVLGCAGGLPAARLLGAAPPPGPGCCWGDFCAEGGTLAAVPARTSGCCWADTVSVGEVRWLPSLQEYPDAAEAVPVLGEVRMLPCLQDREAAEAVPVYWAAQQLPSLQGHPDAAQEECSSAYSGCSSPLDPRPLRGLTGLALCWSHYSRLQMAVLSPFQRHYHDWWDQLGQHELLCLVPSDQGRLCALCNGTARHCLTSTCTASSKGPIAPALEPPLSRLVPTAGRSWHRV